jgi:hypothetical protein
LLFTASAASAGAADAGAFDASAADAGVLDAGTGTGTGTGGDSVKGCVESVPPGAARPVVKDTFPDRGTSGWASTLVIDVEHGKGETVLPRGIELQTSSDFAKELRGEGWVVPAQDGGAGARLSVGAPDAKTGRVTTRVELPLLALPPEPGRHVMLLPPLPVVVARASGEVGTVCTHPHRITVEDPIASVPDPQPKPNLAPLVQREEWKDLERVLAIAGAGALIGALAFFLVRRWLRRPKPVPAPPPPRPPWEIALERLDEVRHAGLLETGRFAEYFDRVNDAVRWYLGARYGFDGLECTTDETVKQLEHASLAGVALPELVVFLQDCDLVKFANLTPTTDACTKAIEDGERIVRSTRPRLRPIDRDEPRDEAKA